MQQLIEGPCRPAVHHDVMSLPIMQHFISPTFTHKKLESPSYEDLIDVFEDRTRNWFFLPAAKLLDVPHGEIAAVGLLVNYFEGIEIYLAGEDSKNRSSEFFARGFEKVFTVGGQDAEFAAKISATNGGAVSQGRSQPG